MIEYAPVSLFRSPTVSNGTHPTKVGLSGDVTNVLSGTPLKPDPDGKGWVIAHDGLGEFVAATGGHGTDVIDGLRIATINFHRQPEYGRPYFKVGARYSVKDVDDKGIPEFELDPEGPFLAVDRTSMLMDMTIAALYLHAVDSKRAEADAQPVDAQAAS